VSNVLNVGLSAPELLNGGVVGDPSVAWVERRCASPREVGR
jgi:hypothetical protein